MARPPPPAKQRGHGLRLTVVALEGRGQRLDADRDLVVARSLLCQSTIAPVLQLALFVSVSLSINTEESY